MLPEHSKASFAKRFIARLLVALALASSLLSSVAPFSTASSTKLCTMACCLGKAPHVAGSCVHESCETPPLQAHAIEAKEHLCGEEVLAQPKPVVKRRLGLRVRSTRAVTRRSAAVSPQNSVANFRKPCPPDCGAAVCSSPNQRRSRELLTVALSEHAQVPLHRSLHTLDYALTFSEAAPRNCPARAPPTLPS